MEVKIYSTPTCGYCHMAKKFLSERGILFKEYDVSIDQNAAREMVELTGQMGVPVIVVNNEVVIGFDRARLEQLLTQGNSNISLGISIADASNMILNNKTAIFYGAYIGKVRTGSVAERAGLLPGDIITEFNSKPIHNADDLQRALSGLNKGDRVFITYIRGENTFRSELII